MIDFLVQNKHRLNMHKENNTKIKNMFLCGVNIDCHNDFFC
jgi:hypothetical protein